MPIAGYLGPDPASADVEVRKSTERLTYSASDSPALIRFGSCVLGATEGSFLWQDGSSGTMAAWSGALYNARELAQSLSLDASATPAQIATHAFLKYGLEFPDKLYGEFAVAVWDAVEQRLLLARDGMGRAPIFFSRIGSSYAFASEPRGLRGWPGIDGSIDEQVIAGVLSVQHVAGRSLFRGISVVPSASVLSLAIGREPVATTHWHPLQRPQMRAKDWREYAEAIYQAMEDAVAVRLPQTGLVASQISSGFDSSSVTALAAQALAKQNRPLLAYTSVPVHATKDREIVPDRFGNEWPLAAKVAAMYPNMEHIAVPTNAGTLWDALDMNDFSAAPAGFIRNSRWFYGILKDAQDRGAGTMMEGQAGNLTGSYNGGFGPYDLRRRGQWLQLAKALRDRHRHGMKWATLARFVWMPGAKANHFLDRVRRRRTPKLFELSLMREDFYRSSGLEQKTLSAMGSVIEGDRSSGAAWRFSILSKGDLGMMHAMERRGFGLERQDPTADRRLVETVLSIPDEAFAPNGMRRELYREAFRKHLPAELLDEPLRGLQSSDFLLHFEVDLPLVYEELERLEATPAVANILDLPRMRTMLDNFHKNVASSKPMADRMYNYTVGGALSLGRFLRRHEEGKQR